MRKLFSKLFGKLKSLNLNNRQYLIASIAIVVLLISIFLVGKSLSVSYQPYQQYRDGMTELVELEADFDREILKSRYELFASYDPLVENLSKQRSIQQALQNIPGFVDAQKMQMIDRSLQQKLTLLEEKEQLSERFKSRNALLKNSLRYLPLLSSQVEEKNNKSVQDKGLKPEVFASLTSTLNPLIRKLLVYNIVVDKQLASEIEGLTQKLLDIDLQNKVSKDEFPTETIVSHAQIILRTKPQVEVLTTQLLSPSKQPNENLEQIFEESYQQAVRRVNLYRILTLIWFLGILAVSNYLWLKRSHRQQGPNFSTAKQHIKKIIVALTPLLANPSEASNTDSFNTNGKFARLDSYEKDLEQIDREVQRTAEYLQNQKSQLQQQIQELNTQLETARQERERAVVQAEETKLNRQILELSATLEQVRSESKPIQTESNFSEGSIAHLSLLTKNQRQLITPQISERLETVLGNALNEQECQPIDFQSSPEQIRLLFRHPPQIGLSQLVVHLKQVSSTCLYEEFRGDLQNIKDPSNIWSDTYFLTVSEAGSSREDKQTQSVKNKV